MVRAGGGERISGAISSSVAAAMAGGVTIDTGARRRDISAMADEINNASKAQQNFNIQMKDGADKIERLSGGVDAGRSSYRGFNMEIMATSISLFVSGLIVRQLTTGIVQLAKAFGLSDEDARELSKTVSAMNSAFAMIIGPLQLYVMWQWLAQAGNVKLALSFMGVAAAAAAAFAVVGLITAKSGKLKAAYATLLGVMVALTAASWARVAAELSVMAANPLTLIYVPIALGAIAGIIGAVAGFAAAETPMGFERIVERGGPVIVHTGERIGRVSAPSHPTGQRGGNITYNITSNDPFQTAKMIERNDRRGLGRVRTKRNVV